MSTPRKPSQPSPLQAQFAAGLRQLRMEQDKPAEAVLARKMGCARSTVSDFLAGKRFPTWKQVQEFLATCYGDDRWHAVEADWHAKWTQAHQERDALRRGHVVPEPSSPEVLDAFTPGPTATSHIPVTWYEDNPGFYRAAAESIITAQREIRVTYIRQYPPTAFTTQASVDYFAKMLEWARRAGDRQRSVQRIIGIPHKDGAPDQATLSWVGQHRAETADILSYEATILPWHAPGDGLNMAIIDDDLTFLAFSGGSRQRLNGFSVRSREYASYFVRHYDQLWSTLEPLETFLERIAPPATPSPPPPN